MSTVEVKPDSYEELRRLAAARGSSVENLVELAISDLLRRQASSAEDWLHRWKALQAEIQRKMPSGVNGEEIEADIDAAIAEVRAERRARSR